jgi:hypothetical protein
MKYLYFSVLFIFSNLCLPAQQEFASIGTKWTYNYSNNEEIGYQTLEVVGDTTIKNRNCSKIHWEQFFVERQSNSSEDPLYRSKGFRYVNQNIDSIFYFDTVRDSFILLLDLSIREEESFLTIYSSLHPFFPSFSPEGITYSHYVLDEDSVTISYNDIQKKLKRVKIFAECNATGLATSYPKFLIESIGPTFFLFYNELECNWPNQFFNWQLICYEDNERNIKFSDEECRLITSSYNIKEDQTYLLYPNPASYSINFTPNADVELVTLYNTMGELFYESKSPTLPLNIEQLAPGIYFLKAKFRNSDSFQQFHFIKN